MNPSWTCDTQFFEIENGLLKSKGSIVGNSRLYLSTVNSMINNAEWRFLVKLDFNPTSTSFVRLYLVSNAADLKGLLNGYYIQLGQTTADSIKLFRQDGTLLTELFRGTSNLGTSSILVRIKVTRSSTGLWHVYADPTRGDDYESEVGPCKIKHTYKLKHLAFIGRIQQRHVLTCTILMMCM